MADDAIEYARAQSPDAKLSYVYFEELVGNLRRTAGKTPRTSASTCLSRLSGTADAVHIKNGRYSHAGCATRRPNDYHDGIECRLPAADSRLEGSSSRWPAEGCHVLYFRTLPACCKRQSTTTFFLFPLGLGNCARGSQTFQVLSSITLQQPALPS